MLHDPRPRDASATGILIALAMALMVPWAVQELSGDRYVPEVVAQMTSCYMLPALGFLLALRCGVIDLSVWMSFSLGSVLAAIVLRDSSGHLMPVAAMGLAVLAGGVVGGANALLASLRHVPGVVVTGVVALVVFLLINFALGPMAVVPSGMDDSAAQSGGLLSHGGAIVPVDDRAFDEWHVAGQPLLVTRALVVACVYAVVMVAMLLAEAHLRLPQPARMRWTLRASLLASGMLAAIGGACWIIQQRGAVIPSTPIGDLRIPAAAVLAGGLLLAGQGRTLLACIYLPPAMLMVTVWWLRVWDLSWGGYAFQMLLLIASVIVCGLAGPRALASRNLKLGAVLPALLAYIGFGALAGAGAMLGTSLHRTLHWAGIACLGAGTILLAVDVARSRSTAIRA